MTTPPDNPTASTNGTGTTLNGRAIDGRAPLVDGAVIVLGTTVLKFRVQEPAGSTVTIEPPA